MAILGDGLATGGLADMSTFDDPLLSGSTTIPRALTIAGSDSGAGAGIQADLKTFSALGVYGVTAITAITAQNTQSVRAAWTLTPELVEAQIDAVLEDIGADVAKTGMLASSEIIEVVARCVSRWKLPLVVDPVMLAKSGDPLLAPEAVTTLRNVLLPLATVVTPNIPEAEALCELRIETVEDMRVAARALSALGPRCVVVKGGHRMDRAIDILFDGERFMEFLSARIETPHTHGTGCTFSAAIAAFLARGRPVHEAVSGAKQYITEAIRQAPGIGKGHGPVEHFWHWKQFQAEANKCEGEHER
jgi:hydroxymethylpyrimidine/phosphomethylpyrimidine kinase